MTKKLDEDAIDVKRCVIYRRLTLRHTCCSSGYSCLLTAVAPTTVSSWDSAALLPSYTVARSSVLRNLVSHVHRPSGDPSFPTLSWVFCPVLVLLKMSTLFLVLFGFFTIQILPRTFKRCNYQKSANFVVNIKTSRFLPRFLCKIEENCKERYKLQITLKKIIINFFLCVALHCSTVK